MALDLLAFDWSGTVSNDLMVVFPSANNILMFFNRPPITLEHYREVFGYNIVDVYRSWGVNASFEQLNKMHSDFLKRQPRPKPMPGAVETVRKASNYANKVAVFSAHPEEEIRKDIENWGLEGYIDEVYGGITKHDDVDFSRMLRQMRAKSESTLYVADTTVDIDLAVRNLVRCAIVVNRKDYYQKPEKVRSNFPPARHYLNYISAQIPLLE